MFLIETVNGSIPHLLPLIRRSHVATEEFGLSLTQVQDIAINISHIVLGEERRTSAQLFTTLGGNRQSIATTSAHRSTLGRLEVVRAEGMSYVMMVQEQLRLAEAEIQGLMHRLIGYMDGGPFTPDEIVTLMERVVGRIIAEIEVLL